MYKHIFYKEKDLSGMNDTKDQQEPFLLKREPKLFFIGFAFLQKKSLNLHIPTSI